MKVEPTMGHISFCAVHNEPAYPAGPCNCGADWVSAETPPPADRPDCIVKMSDGSVRAGNACHDPRDGRFAGWMFDGDPETDGKQVEVIEWRYEYPLDGEEKR